MSPALALTLVCALAVAALLATLRAGDRRGAPIARAVAKLTASTAFVGVAVALGAWDSRYGRWVLGALVLGWLGDALLLGRAKAWFLGGLVAFLLSHGLYATAFTAGPLAPAVLTPAAVLAAVAGGVALRWLLPHAPRGLRGPVALYVAVILAMCVAAAGHAAASGRWAVLAGALLFAVSDVAVARDRFVQPGPVNKAWGWPTYFAAQLVLAWTVAGHVGMAR